MSKKNKSGLAALLGGAAIGAGLGILFAPKKGSETRKDIKNKADEIIDNMKKIDKEEVADKLKSELKKMKEELASLDKETAMEIVKENANKLIKKADELMTCAKEACDPVIEKAAEDVKAKTLIILKNAVEKLETEEPKKTPSKKNNKTTKNKNA